MPLIILLLFALQASQVYALTWTRTGYTEPWDNVASPYLLSHKGWNVDSAHANFTYGNIGNIGDNQGVQINFTVSIKGDRREWWWWEGTKRFYFALGLHGSGGSAYALYYIAHEQGIVIRTSEAKCGTQLQYNVGKPFPTTMGETVDTTEALWYIQIIRINSTTAKVIYATNLLAGNDDFKDLVKDALDTWTEILTVDPTVWENPELVLHGGHDGSGEFTVSFSDPQIGDMTELKHQLPSVVNPDPFQWLRDGLNFLLSLTTLVTVIVSYFLPILPWIFLFYTLDVVITSVQVGSVQPIGKFALMIWDFLLRIWDVLVKFGQLIWDAITFWT